MASRSDLMTADTPTTASLAAALAYSWQLILATEAFAAQFALPDIDIIELPPQVYNEADAHNLRTAATLYLAAELEAGHLLPTIELLAGLARSGGIRLQRGPAADQLYQFWRRRNERFSAEERQAFFARLFGGGHFGRLAMADNHNNDFELLMIDFTEALITVDTSLPAAYRTRTEIELRTIGQRLADNLLPRSSGLASYAARDIISATQEALTILKQPAILQAVGATSVWGVIQQVSRRYAQTNVDIRAHIQRGSAGMTLLAWLADHYNQLGPAATTVLLSGSADPIIVQARVWLQTSLAIAERELSAG